MAVKPKSSEIHPGPGFRVRRHITRPAPEIIKRFWEFDTADISDLMNRLYTMDLALKNQVNTNKIVGPACTVKVFPGDNLMVHKALDIAHPGDIVVVDAGASSMNGIMGDLISSKATHRGIAGYVIDGLIRDVAAVRDVGMPIYARGVTPIGPLHRGPGEINFAVSCGGIVVNPGDIIVGDTDGVVVVRQEFAEELLGRLDRQRDSMRDYVAGVKAGNFSNEWVDNMLDSQNCVYVD
jgi:RraA family protein